MRRPGWGLGRFRRSHSLYCLHLLLRAADRGLSHGHLCCRFRLRRCDKSEQGFQSLGARPHAGGIVGLGDLCHLYQGDFSQQALVGTLPVVDVTLVEDAQRLVQERYRATLCLLFVALLLLFAHLEQGYGLGIARHEHVAHMGGKSVDKSACVEALGEHLIEQHHDVGGLVLESLVDNLEVVFAVEDI